MEKTNTVLVVPLVLSSDKSVATSGQALDSILLLFSADDLFDSAVKAARTPVTLSTLLETCLSPPGWIVESLQLLKNNILLQIDLGR